MKGYLLDTQIFLWCLIDSPRLKGKVREIIVNPMNPVYVSAVSTWEIAVKKSIGKLRAPDNIDKIVDKMGFLKLPIYLYHADFLFKLPMYHKDPFDRMLIAQAIAEELIIITADRRFREYKVKVLTV